MFAKKIITVVLAALGTPVALAQTTRITTEEQALISWATQFQSQARTVCERISMPSREEMRRNTETSTEQVTEAHQRHYETSVNGLAYAANQDRPAVIMKCGWGFDLEREVTLRKAMLLRAWKENERANTTRVAALEAIQRERAADREMKMRRVHIMYDEVKLAQVERHSREVVLTRAAKQFATNWLLAGNPEACLPTKWSELAKHSGGSMTINTGTEIIRKNGDAELQTIQKSIKELTSTLVAVGMGEMSPEQLVKVERQLRVERSKVQQTMAVRTGMTLAGLETRLASVQ